MNASLFISLGFQKLSCQRLYSVHCHWGGGVAHFCVFLWCYLHAIDTENKNGIGNFFAVGTIEDSGNSHYREAKPKQGFSSQSHRVRDLVATLGRCQRFSFQWGNNLVQGYSVLDDKQTFTGSSMQKRKQCVFSLRELICPQVIHRPSPAAVITPHWRGSHTAGCIQKWYTNVSCFWVIVEWTGQQFFFCSPRHCSRLIAGE